MDENENLLARADEIMNSAVKRAEQLIVDKPQIAEIILRQLLKCDPEHSSGLQLLGLCKHRMGQNTEAIEIFQTALELDPKNGDNWNNMGIAYGGLENPEKAVECIEKAIRYKPGQYLFYNNLALQYRALGEYDKAIKTMERALEIQEAPQLLVNLGGIYGEMKDAQNARKYFERACQMAPTYSAAHVDMAFAYHLEGEWEKGFKEYEWRFDYYPQLIHYKTAYDAAKLWDGEASLEDKRVLIYCEQGVGDAIQFIRYIPQLKERRAYIIVHCQESLRLLLDKCVGVDEICVRDIVHKCPEFPLYDFQCASMSLPLLLGDFILRGEPYIKPTTDRFKEYIQRSYSGTFNIGVVWAGSPAHPHDKKRSIPLKYFRVLHDIPGVKLFNLQVDVRPRQYGIVHRNVNCSDENKLVANFKPEQHVINYCEGCEDMSLVDLTPLIQNFEDTATVLAGLDLVICCDTAIGHLAGAMGMPCWVAIPFNPDWRWTYDGETTGWYNSVRLFRQKERNQWGEVFEKMREELIETVLPNKRQELPQN